ncbi:protein GIGAS CELL1-like [Bidens hawaiensis]|uniref:protein GIGAS CELL1-like n=1 Tax=Bidens hawaiensis TaxID=980011 RepID=UPI00404B308D
MTESRYRRHSNNYNNDDEVAEAYARTLTSARTIRILPDEMSVPFRWGSTPLTGDVTLSPTAAFTRGGGYGYGRRRGLVSTPTGSRGGRTASRTPLADISHVMTGSRGGRTASRTPFRDIPRVAVRGGGAQLEDEDSFVTPKPKSKTVVKPTTLGKVPNILNAIANDVEGGSDLTPQKKLLDSIHIVEKVVMEELDRLRRTPAARRAEREKKVKTLMSMR